MGYEPEQVSTENEKYLINIAQNDLFHGLVLQNLANNTSITSPDHEYLLRIRMACEG